jgi:hypothetical protein
MERLAAHDRLPRRAVLALDAALDLDADRKPIPPHIAREVERAIVDARAAFSGARIKEQQITFHITMSWSLQRKYRGENSSWRQGMAREELLRGEAFSPLAARFLHAHSSLDIFPSRRLAPPISGRNRRCYAGAPANRRACDSQGNSSNPRGRRVQSLHAAQTMRSTYGMTTRVAQC